LSLEREIASVSPRTLISVVMPCLNEEEAVGDCVTEAFTALAQAGFDAEVIVVDNGSDDRSAEKALSAGATLVSEPLRGYGSALRAGFAAAHGDVIVMADADASYDLSKLPDLAGAIISAQAEIVLGNRFGPGHRDNSMPWMHKWIGTPVLSVVTRLVTGKWIKDSQSGFRAFSRASLAALDLKSTGMELASEILLRANALGYQVLEIETGYRPRRGPSKLMPMQDAWRHMRLIILWGPHVFFVIPGLISIFLGLAVKVLALAQGGVLTFGSARWKPIFFGTLLLVVGMQAALLGTLLLSLSNQAPPRWRNRATKFLDTSRLLQKGLGALALFVSGLVLELFLVLSSLVSVDLGRSRLPLSSVAQDCLLTGGSLGLFVVAVAALTSREPAQ